MRRVCPDCREAVELVPLHEVDGLEARVEAGDVVPVGECPQCGALLPPADGDNGPFESLSGPERDRALTDAIDDANEELNRRLTAGYRAGLRIDVSVVKIPHSEERVVETYVYRRVKPTREEER